MDKDTLITIGVISFLIIMTVGIMLSWNDHEKDVEENWSCEDVKEHIVEHGDTKNGFYFQQLMKKDCSFP